MTIETIYLGISYEFSKKKKFCDFVQIIHGYTIKFGFNLKRIFISDNSFYTKFSSQYMTLTEYDF